MPHPMTRLCDRFRLKEFDFHSFAPRRRVVDMSGGPRRGSDSPDLMYLSAKAIHTFWAPRQGFQTDIYGPCVRFAAGGPTVSYSNTSTSPDLSFIPSHHHLP